MQDRIMVHPYSRLKRKARVSDPRLVYGIAGTWMERTKCVIAEYSWPSGGAKEAINSRALRTARMKHADVEGSVEDG